MNWVKRQNWFLSDANGIKMSEVNSAQELKNFNKLNLKFQF